MSITAPCSLSKRRWQDGVTRPRLDETASYGNPQRGYFEFEQGRYGPVFPKTPAHYGFTIIAKVKPGREDAIREHGKTIEKAIKADPYFLGPLKLHFLRWLLFDTGSGLEFMYQGIFDTEFDKYTDDAVALFGKSGISTVFENLEDFLRTGKRILPRSLSSFATTTSRASSNMVSIHLSRATKSKKP